LASIIGLRNSQCIDKLFGCDYEREKAYPEVNRHQNEGPPARQTVQQPLEEAGRGDKCYFQEQSYKAETLEQQPDLS